MLARFQAQRKEISLSLPGATSRTATHQSPQGCASRDAHRAAESHSPSMARSDEKRADFSTMRHERDRLSQETRLLKAELRGLWDDGSGRDVLECRQDCAAPAGDASLADYLTATRGARHDFSHPSEYSIAGRGSVDAGELQEIADIASLLRTEREIADVATGSGGDADDARRDFEAQREAVSLMQRQLQAQHIEIEARLRDVTAQEKHLQKREAQTNSLQATTGGQLEYKSKEVEAAMQQLQHMQQALAEREADLEQRESMVRDISERESKVKVLEQQASQQAEEAEKKERQQTLQQRALDDRSRKLKEDEDRRIEEADGRQKEQQQIMEERYRQMDEDEKKTRQAALHKLNELIKRETALKTLEKTLDAQQQEAQRLSGRIGEQEKVLQERQRAAVDGRREFESKCEARRRALKEEDLRVSEHAAKVERTKAEVGRMAAKLEHLIQANTSAEQALVDERQVLRNERSSLQDREREATRRVAEAEAASIVRLADIERREHELQRREHELSERQRTCDDMLQQAQRKTEECERNMQQRESICAARDLEYQREREQQARLRSEEQLEAQASLNEALQQVHTLSQSKASAHAALEAHSNLVRLPAPPLPLRLRPCVCLVCAWVWMT